MSYNSKELILFNNEDPGLPSDSNVLWIDSHGSRSGNNILVVPENVYIISPCKDDISWSIATYYENEMARIKAINSIDSENIESFTGMWGNQHNLYSKISQKLNSMFVKLRLHNTPDNLNALLTRKIFSELHKLKKGDNINNVFRWGCDEITNKFGEPASEACLRYCVNGPGSYIKNMDFSGSHTPSERYFGSRMHFFENKSGNITEMIFNGSKKYSKEWEKMDPEGFESVMKSVENISESFKERIIHNRVTLKEILFYYKNLGPVSFQKFNDQVNDSDFTATFEKRCNEPLIIFTGNACRGDRYMELGYANTKNTFLRKSQHPNVDELEKLIKDFMWNNLYYQKKENIYLTPPGSISYIGPFTNFENRKLVREQGKKEGERLFRITNSLKTSTFVEGSSHELSKYLNNHCSVSRPRLKEYLDDIRAIKNRKYRNITSNKIGVKENKMCELLASIGLSVGSKIAIVIPNYGETEKISNIISHKFIKSAYYHHKIVETSKIINLSKILKNENIRDSWSIILLTNIRGIEKNMLSIGTPLLYFSFMSNYYQDNHGEKINFLEKNEKKSIDNFYRKFNIKYSYKNESNAFYGKSGKISESITNMPFSILTHAFWNPDQDLIKIMKKKEKIIPRIKLYNTLLKINKSSKHYGKGGKKKKTLKKKKSKKNKHNRNILKFSKRRKR